MILIFVALSRVLSFNSLSQEKAECAIFIRVVNHSTGFAMNSSSRYLYSLRSLSISLASSRQQQFFSFFGVCVHIKLVVPYLMLFFMAKTTKMIYFFQVSLFLSIYLLTCMSAVFSLLACHDCVIMQKNKIKFE